MHIKKYLFCYKVRHDLKNTKAMTEIFHAAVDLYLLKVCAKFIGKVTRKNKRVKEKSSYASIYFH